MHPDEVFTKVGNLPYMKLEDAHLFFEFILHNRLLAGLELGFFHGMSSAYLAGALEELPGGRLTTIDLHSAQKRNPNIDWVLSETGLSHLVEIYYEPKTFNWRLMKFLSESPPRTFSFCYIDGGHTWEDTGLAFCVVDRLLNPGGWVIFDDIYFTFRDSKNKDKSWVRRMPEEEQITPQIKLVFELLVESHEGFANFRRIGGRFAFAQKKEPGVDYLPKKLDIAVSRALERAHADPEFRHQLLSEPQNAELLIGCDQAHLLRFEESGTFAPMPAEKVESGRFLIPVEQSAWETYATRSDLEGLLNN